MIDFFHKKSLKKVDFKSQWKANGSAIVRSDEFVID